MLQVPPDRLSPAALDGLIEEFVTRHGTDLAESSDKAGQVRRLLEDGEVVIVFDEETESCNIVRKDYRPEVIEGGAPGEARVEPIEAPARPRPPTVRRVEVDEGRSIVYDEPPPPDTSD